jgi:hypothetical protein
MVHLRSDGLGLWKRRAPAAVRVNDRQETAMTPFVQFTLATAVLFGAASAAYAGANDQFENGNDRYPWLYGQPSR